MNKNDKRTFWKTIGWIVGIVGLLGLFFTPLVLKYTGFTIAVVASFVVMVITGVLCAVYGYTGNKNFAKATALIIGILALALIATYFITMLSANTTPNDAAVASATAPPIVSDDTAGTSATAAPVNIPTNAEMQEAFGFDKSGIKPVFTGVDWDPAKWNLQWVSDEPLKILLLKDWEFTVTLPNGDVAVYYGDGVTELEVMGATFRYLPCYVGDNSWAWDKQKMLKYENEYSHSCTPSYDTIAGNFTEE